MNLNAIASRVVGVVNPNVYGDVYLSDGYTTDEQHHRQPKYRQLRNIRMQVQGLTEQDVFHTDALNISGSTNTIYINGRVDGLVRGDNKGGDLITLNGQTWLVRGVLELWPDWCKVAVTLQRDAGPPVV